MTHDHANRAVAVHDLGPAFACGVGLNTTFVAIEAGYGFASGLLALIADIAHNLTDVAGSLRAWRGNLEPANAECTAHLWYG